MDIFFINKKTTVDDIIERILYDLNVTLIGNNFAFHDYCVPEGKDDHEFDRIMEVKLRETMLKHNLVTPLQNAIGFMNKFRLSGTGADIYTTDGWKKFKLNYDKEQKEIKARQNRPTSIHVKGSAIIGDNNKNNNQSGRDLSVFPHIQPDTSPTQNITNPKHTEVNMSKAQFIFWLFTAFGVGFMAAIAIMNFLKH